MNIKGNLSIFYLIFKKENNESLNMLVYFSVG